MREAGLGSHRGEEDCKTIVREGRKEIKGIIKEGTGRNSSKIQVVHIDSGKVRNFLLQDRERRELTKMNLRHLND